jgi:hypothetical protein
VGRIHFSLLVVNGLDKLSVLPVTQLLESIHLDSEVLLLSWDNGATKITMSIFSKLFRSSDERQVDRIVEESGKETTRILAPLFALSGTIILASQKCRDGLKTWIVASNGKDRPEMEDFAFYEFVYFFLHLTMRQAFVAMTKSEKDHLGKFLLETVAKVCVDGSFEHLPDDLRKRMIAEFCTNLQMAEIQYAKCATGDIFSDSDAERHRNLHALFTTLGDNVALKIGRSDDIELKSKILILAIEQFGEVNLLEFLLDYKRDSMELSDAHD